MVQHHSPAEGSVMRAVVCPKYGPPEVLEQRDVARPVCPEDGMVVRIKATTVTVADIRIRGFRVPSSYWVPARLALGATRPRNPVLGSELSGVVEEIGRKAQRFAPGDEVFALTGHEMGCYAEHRGINEKGIIALKPRNLGHEEAAALPLGGLTALHFLREGKVGSGQKVLVYGASGSIGTYAVQLAKYLGAEVTAVCSTANLGLVGSLGADEVIDYTKENFSDHGGPYDVVLDAVGKASLLDSVRSLKKGGHLLEVVATPGVAMRMRWAGLANDIQTIGGTTAASVQDLTLLKELAEARKIRPVIDRTYPMEQIVEAHRYVDQGHKKGNVVIRI